MMDLTAYLLIFLVIAGVTCGLVALVDWAYDRWGF